MIIPDIEVPTKSQKNKPLAPLESLPPDEIIPGRQVWKYISSIFQHKYLPDLRVHEVQYFQKYYKLTGMVPRLIIFLADQKKGDEPLIEERLEELFQSLYFDYKDCAQRWKLIKNSVAYQTDENYKREQFNMFYDEAFQLKFKMWDTYFQGKVQPEMERAQKWHKDIMSKKPSHQNLKDNYIKKLLTKIPIMLKYQMPRHVYRYPYFLYD